MNWTLRSCVLASLILAGLGMPAAADWSEDFDGGFDQAWAFDSLTPTGAPSPTFSASIVNNELVMTDPVPVLSGGAVSGFGLVLGESFTDVRMTGWVNPSGDFNVNDSLFLLARGNPIDNTFYSAEVNFTNFDLIIYRNDGLGVGSNLSSSPLPFGTFSAWVEFEVEGTDLRLSAYDAPNGNLLASTTASDSTYPGGVSGVLVDDMNGLLDAPLLASFDDLSASAIQATALCDVNADGSCNLADLDQLYDNIALGTSGGSSDIDGSGTVDNNDIDDWLVAAGSENGFEYRPGDVDFDGSVTGPDFTSFAAQFGTTGTPGPGPYWANGNFDGADGDGIFRTGGSDFTQLAANFGHVSTQSVPEPAGLPMLLVAALAICGIRRR